VFRIYLPEQVVYILDLLKRNGHEAFTVGGCVRDSVLGKIPGDWDITTSAVPEQIKQIFQKTYDTGIKHGTVTVVLDEQHFEITTYRIEGSYNDYRHPSQVLFTRNIIEDLKRRDFTMNAIAFNPDTGFVDPFDGISDIKNKIIRCVGNPEERFREDALRMLRAVRFAGQLDFEIEPDTLEAVKRCSSLIANISSERIRDELSKLLVSDHPEKIILMVKTRLADSILAEFARCMLTEQRHPYHVYNVGIHTIETLKNIRADFVLRWTMLLHDMGKPLTRTADENGIDHFYGHGRMSEIIANDVLKRLRFDNKSIRKITRLVKWHDRPIEPAKEAVKRAIRAVGEDIIEDLLEVQEADMRGQNPEFLRDRLEKHKQVKKIYNEIIEQQECCSIKDLAVNGNDLMEIGFKRGREIGTALEKLLDYVMEYPEMNTKEQLLEYAKIFIKMR